jgi:hypothetical protein
MLIHRDDPTLTVPLYSGDESVQATREAKEIAAGLNKPCLPHGPNNEPSLAFP